MKSITIRGIDDLLQKELKKISNKEHKSLNKTILSLLRTTLGIEEKTKYPTYNDLEHLAGTWTKEDEKEFNKATSLLNKIDEDMWKCEKSL